MKILFNKRNKNNKRIYDIKQVEEYLDKIEGIKRKVNVSKNNMNLF